MNNSASHESRPGGWLPRAPRWWPESRGRPRHCSRTVFLGSGILLTGVMLVGAAALGSTAITVDLADGRVPDASVLAAFNGLGTTLLLVVLLRVQADFVATTSTLCVANHRVQSVAFKESVVEMVFFDDHRALVAALCGGAFAVGDVS